MLYVDVMESSYCQDLLVHLLTLLQSENIDVEILEQGLCALGNVCASSRGKQLVMNNLDCLNVIKKGLNHPDVLIEKTAVFCVSNLAACEDDLREDKLHLGEELSRNVVLFDSS